MKQNVSMRYGKPVAEFIFPCVKSYSTVKEKSTFREYMQATKQQFGFIQIPLHEWHNMEWVWSKDLLCGLEYLCLIQVSHSIL